MAEIITANRLSDGEVVYFTHGGEWSERLADAAVAADKNSAQALLTLAQAERERVRAVEPYLMAVDLSEGRAVPLGQREIIRAKGPTVHPDFGKQARGNSTATFAGTRRVQTNV